MSEFCNEFWIKESMQKSIENGTLLVNGQVVTTDYILRNGDVISQLIHCHDHPILDIDIPIIYQENDMIVVDKPCSIPVYSHSKSLVNIFNAHVINRLDKLTSGIVILSKSSKKTAEIHGLMSSLEITKIYLARVEGYFPDYIECHLPLKTVKCRTFVCDDGKEAHTIFKRLSFNGETSLIQCRPLTGRTHQIRCHLQALGFPIANDHHYGNYKRKQGFLPVINYQRVGNCPDCENPKKCLQEEDMGIWLHAWKYYSKMWFFKASLPTWAVERNV